MARSSWPARVAAQWRAPTRRPQAGHESHAEANGGAGLFQPAKWESAELVEPEVRRSVDGELATELRVHYAYADIGGYRLSLRTYEGAIPGPTLAGAAG